MKSQLARPFLERAAEWAIADDRGRELLAALHPGESFEEEIGALFVAQPSDPADVERIGRHSQGRASGIRRERLPGRAPGVLDHVDRIPGDPASPEGSRHRSGNRDHRIERSNRPQLQPLVDTVLEVAAGKTMKGGDSGEAQSASRTAVENVGAVSVRMNHVRALAPQPAPHLANLLSVATSQAVQPMDFNPLPRQGVEKDIVGSGTVDHRQDRHSVTESPEAAAESHDDFLQAAEFGRSHRVQELQVALTFKANSRSHANFRLRQNLV